MEIIGILFVGLLLGSKFADARKIKIVNFKIQKVVMISMLFSIGGVIGSNKAIISQIGSLGFKSFVFAVFTSLFSFVIVHLIVRKFKV